MAVGHFEAYKTATKKWRFRLKAGNGEIICQGEEYETKQGCLKGIASIQRNAGKAEVEIIDNVSKNGKKLMKPRQLVKKIIKDEKTEEVSDEQRNSDEKKVLVAPNGPSFVQMNRIPLPGQFGPRWL